ncbi:MAG: hypothetical protein ACFBSG_20380 [Leptolyngbyaceae cyanobacterium]
MPEEPIPPEESMSSEPSSAPTEPEWTDDNSYQTLDNSADADASVGQDTDSRPSDEWGAASLAWEEELSEPPETPPQPTTTREALAWIQPAWQRFQRFWLRLLVGVRNRIPAAAKLSNSVLSAILIGVLVLLLIVINSLRQPASASLDEPRSTTAPAQNVPAATSPAEPLPVVEPAPASDVEPASEPPTSDRIAQIQVQLTDSEILNAQRVIDSVQADFNRNAVTLNLNGDWYRLSNYDRRQLANALRQRSEKLDFSSLQMQDTEGRLVARSPVVGDAMVILLNEPPPEVPLPERPRYRILVDR